MVRNVMLLGIALSLLGVTGALEAAATLSHGLLPDNPAGTRAGPEPLTRVPGSAANNGVMRQQAINGPVASTHAEGKPSPPTGELRNPASLYNSSDAMP